MCGGCTLERRIRQRNVVIMVLSAVIVLSWGVIAVLLLRH